MIKHHKVSASDGSILLTKVSFLAGCVEQDPGCSTRPKGITTDDNNNVIVVGQSLVKTSISSSSLHGESFSGFNIDARSLMSFHFDLHSSAHIPT